MNKKPFLKTLAYIRPQLVCLQHHQGHVLPSLTMTISVQCHNLHRVCTIWNVAYRMTNLCTTGPHSSTHLLDQVMIPKPQGPLPRLQYIENQLRTSSLTPQEAYKELLTAVTDLRPTPDMVLIASEKAIRKLTWGLPFIFDILSRKAHTVSPDQSMEIYTSQKQIRKTHIDKI